MPTLPSDQPIKIHEQRVAAESFGADAQRYDRTRPGYPAALIERLVAASPGRDVLDVGIGTGIAARQFAAAGCHVLGIDPDPRMAAVARAATVASGSGSAATAPGGTGSDASSAGGTAAGSAAGSAAGGSAASGSDGSAAGGFEVEVATFEEWEPAGRTFDLVVAAQTWHWVDPVAGAAQAARVLRPSGRLALFWNAFQPEPAAVEAFDEVYRREMPEMPMVSGAVADGYLSMARHAAEGMRASGGFAEPEFWQDAWTRRYSRDEWLDTVPTFGIAAKIPAATMKRLLDGLGAAVDGLGGAFTMEFTAVTVTAERP